MIPFDDPATLISGIFILIAIVITFITGFKSFNSYRRTKIGETLLISMTAFFLSLAMIFLVLVKVFAEIDPALSLVFFVNVAVIVSGIAFLSLDAFSFKFAFPKRFKILTLLFSLLVILYVGFYIFSPKYLLGDEVVFSPWPDLGYAPMDILVYFTIIPLLIVPILVFSYYSIRVRKTAPFRSKRALFIGLAGLLLAIAYIY
ncbi:MAG: hypothetical protein LUQ65_03830 [Candidatus Helarchaeota archaeon]|nr:hypothetical protein [Candidatus Helarchaeota archaeon]